MSARAPKCEWNENDWIDSFCPALVAPDEAEAMRLIRKAADEGNADSMFNLAAGLAHDDKDDPEQVVWYCDPT